MATRRIGRDFNLGGEQAESDPLLEYAFYESGVYSAIESRFNPKCFLVGRTGSGKSAVLKHLEEEKPEHVIRINPEDLSLTYILDLQVIRTLASLGVHLDPLFIALWKHVLLVEIIRHRYNLDSLAAKNALLQTLKDRLTRDRSKRAALDYLEEFGESFWCETDFRVREITTNFEKKIKGVAAGQMGSGLASGKVKVDFSKQTSRETRSEEADRYQRIVNETQLPRLNKMMDILDDDILDSQNFTYIVVDDLDRDWVDDQLANDLIRCLFRAILDLQRVQNLKVIVALRTNIFAYLDFGSRSGGQEEKVRALAVEMRWTDPELRDLANERARAAGDVWKTEGVSSLADLLPVNRGKRGRPFDFVVGLTLRRPRDVIAFVNEALPLATGKSRLRWEDLYAAELPYSAKRLLALRDEWKPTFPGIDKVFELFRSCPLAMMRAELTRYLDAAALLPAETDFPGVVWMTRLSEPLWNGIGSADWGEMYQPLTQLLYDIGFIGVRLPNKKTCYSYSSPGFADQPSHLDEFVRFEVHPAFRPALEIRTN
jgi:hypothetical protein